MLKKIISFTSVASFILLIILLNLSSPADAGPFGILLIFLFAYLSLTGAATYAIYMANRLISHLSTFFITGRPHKNITLSRSYYFSTIIAAAPIMIIGLQSVDQVGFYDLLLISIFLIVGCFYVSKRFQ